MNEVKQFKILYLKNSLCKTLAIVTLIFFLMSFRGGNRHVDQ